MLLMKEILFLILLFLQMIEVQVDSLLELHATVKKNLRRFLNTCVFYFIRNTRGEITVQYLHSTVKRALLIKKD